LSAKIAAHCPSHNVIYTPYNTIAGKYDAPTVIQTAGETRHLRVVANKTPVSLAKTSILQTSPDLDVAVKLSLDDWADGTAKNIVGRYGAAGTRAWIFSITATDRLYFGWSVDGTTMMGLPVFEAQTVGLTDGTAYWYRFTLDVDDGAGNNVLKCYNSADGITWNTLRTSTTEGTLTLFDHATQRYELGGVDTTTANTVGKIYEVVIRDGIEGPVINPQPLAAWEQTVTRPHQGVALAGTPTIYLYNGAVAGAPMVEYSDPAIIGRRVMPNIRSIVFVCLSHNDIYKQGAAYNAEIAATVAKIRTQIVSPIIVFITQNPETSAAANIAEHAKRRIDQISYAYANNMEVIDAYYDFATSGNLSDLLEVDGVHPSAAGQAFMADIVYRHLFN